MTTNSGNSVTRERVREPFQLELDAPRKEGCSTTTPARKKPLLSVVFTLLVLPHAFGGHPSVHGQQQLDAGVTPSQDVLQYRRPAGKWVEALPLGNGRLGAMVFGSAPSERLQLNEGSLWAMYRSDEEIREIEDAPSDWFPLWTYPPKTKTAPRVRTEYCQDEYARPEDRLPKAGM